MPPRLSSTSTPTSNRLSAVYIGHAATLPDLPSPPSPSPPSSPHTGLPSPPATNSTGSASGDGPPAPSPTPSRKHTHTHTRQNSSISSIGSISTTVPRSASIFEEKEPLLLQQDEDEDVTERFSVSALQRVRSLAQRNRLVLESLSPSTGKRSPAPSTSSHSSSAVSSSSSSARRSLPPPPIAQSPSQRSGSETERESTYSRASSSSQHSHHRTLSFADLPPRDRDKAEGSGSGSSGRRRKRRSAPLLDSTASTVREGSTRRRASPGSGRRRAALPAEFRRTSESPSPYTHDDNDEEPHTPFRAPSRIQYTTSGSSSASRTTTTTSSSSRSRYSLDLASHSNPRPAPATVRTHTPTLHMSAYRERRQTLRGGSAESALALSNPPAAASGKRTLVGEGLRAAGLSPSKRRPPGGRRSLGWEAEGEAGEARERVREGAVTSLANYGLREREEGGRLLRGSRSAGGLLRDASLTRERERERDRSIARDPERERERDITTTALTRFSSRTSTAGTPSPYATRRHLPPTAGEHEHTRLLETSLASLDAAAARARGETRGVDEVVRGAQGVVGAAARLNEMLRGGAARALEEQVRAEVDDAGGGAEGEVWGRVGAEYREGVRASDELVRGLTVLLLGVGKVVRELGAPLDAVVGGGVHARSVSLDEEGLRRRRGGSMSPDVGGVPRTVSGPGSSAGGSASASGSERRSVESRRSWEPSGGGGGRLASLRAESARPASAFGSAALRERERETGRALAGTPRRLFMPREEREMQQVPLGVGEDRPDADAPTVRSQERGYGEYEPSPTPVSRAAREWERDRERERETDRTRAFAPPPKPLPSLPSESLRRNHAVSGSASNTIRDSERRVASISTVRANASTSNNTSNSNSTGTTGTGPSSSSFHPPASLPAPSGTTTALTPHTVSTHTPDRTAFPSLPRTDSDRSVRSSTAPSGAAAAGVAFSRSSVSALVGVRRLDTQRRERERVESGAGGDNNNNKNGTDATDAPAPPQPQPQLQPQLPRARALQLRESRSGSETERPPPRRLLQTLGVRAGGRVSLDGSGGGGGVLPAPQGDLARRGTLGNANGNANGNGHPTDRSAGMGPPMNTAARRERRRTVTDIWPRE